MKTRKGFVSNSSSSSFIISVGEITDREKFNKFCTEHNVTLENNYDFLILNQSEFIELQAESGWGTVLDCGDWAGYWGGTQKVKDFFEENPEATIFIKTGTGPDGDHMFVDDDGDCDYDVDLSDFEAIDQLFYEGAQGTRIFDCHYGAGRDG